MKQLSGETKHAILLEYQPHSPTHGFAALAARHSIAGGRKTVERWYSSWNGTPASLKHKSGAGRPRVLSKAEVSRHVRAPILAANRAHRAVHYTDLLKSAQQKTGKEVSLRSVQRYGKEELGARDKHSKKRTAQESQCVRTCERLAASLHVGHAADLCVQCRLSCVTKLLICDANSGVQGPTMSSFSMRLHFV